MTPALTVFLALGLLSTSAALRADTTHSPTMLERLQRLRDVPRHPVLPAFGQAEVLQAPSAPAGQHNQSQAYRNAQGCIAFFMPPGEQLSGVDFKWSGPACQGKLVSGQGQLLWRVQMGDVQRLAVLEGRFQQGMLSGPGAKAYFHYDLAGRPVPGVHQFRGSFANSVLQGDAVAEWSGAPDARPSAWQYSGRFEEGFLQGSGVLARLRPYPGVDAEIQGLLFGPGGDAFPNQAARNGGRPMKGEWFAEKDPVPWAVELLSWRGAGAEGARVTRLGGGTDNLWKASCAAWRFEDRALVCPGGSIEHRSGEWVVQMEGSGFNLPVGARPGAPAFRLSSQAPLTQIVGGQRQPLSCDPNLLECVGEGVIAIQKTRLYWAGTLVSERGHLRPLKASLQERSADGGFRPESDKVLAICGNFTDALTCESGSISFPDGGSADGGWRLAGVQYAAAAEPGSLKHYSPQGEIRVRGHGWVHRNYPNGRWAEVRYDSAGRVVDVGDCDIPSERGLVDCSLKGERVVFEVMRMQNEPRTRPQRPSRVQSVPERFQPLPNPRRFP